MPANLPPIGMESVCSCYAADVPLRLDVLGIATLDFRGGWRTRVEAPVNKGLGGVTLSIVDYELSADSPVLGRVTISQSDIETTPLSLLEIIRESPPLYRHTMYLDYTITIEKPPFSNRPLVLTNARTVTLSARELVAFPPQGSVYQLHEPIDLVPIGSPNQVAGQLLQFTTAASDA